MAVASTLDEFLGATQDCAYFPEGAPTGVAGSPAEWSASPAGLYLLMLHDAVLYPKAAFGEADGVSEDLPGRLTFRSTHLLVPQGDYLVPDSLGRSLHVPPALAYTSEGRFRGVLPRPVERLAGTHLYCEFVFAHFGHMLVDAPARLWPLHAPELPALPLDGGVAVGLLGAVNPNKPLVPHASALMAAYGMPAERLTRIAGPTQIERLIVPKRLSPQLGPADARFNAVLQAAGRHLEAQATAGLERKTKLFLSRSRLKDDRRSGPGQQEMDALFRELGYRVVHSQELSLPDQIALARGADRIAGPAGSQLHLCGFSERRHLRLFSIGPVHLQVSINARILEPIGGSDTFFVVPARRDPARPRHVQSWALDLEDLKRLRTAVLDWERTTPS
jgi:hypothetical protein